MRDIRFVIPGDPATKTGGYLYDSRLMAGLETRGFSIGLVRLSELFPFPDARALEQAEAAIAELPSGLPVVADGLALGAMPAALVHRLSRDRMLIALVHHPLAAETGLGKASRAHLYETERQALDIADRVVVTGPATARLLMHDYGIPGARIETILPGTDPAPLAEGGEGVCNLLCVATLTPRKNQMQLLDALAAIETASPWRLMLAGSDQRDKAYAARVRSAVGELGLEEHVRMLGEVDQDSLERLYHKADAFVVPSFLEGYGMVFAEALARGLPIVAPRSAAIVETLPEDCGLFVSPGDFADLKRALETLLNAAEDRGRLQAGARKARDDLPRWETAVERFSELLAGREVQKA
ncbi:glycosyltransferase family 4 protein [Fodinicurvata halophila]|uniref:Glycosyltransferase family 4 protein n=1 Tax=Fodinicurvata halophila TaxID=1419723 RepID=A0ABV8UI17_9PROT